MAGLATQETDRSVDAFIDGIDNKSKQEDSRTLRKLMEEVTGNPAKVWGEDFIIGFGKYSYTRKGGKEEFEWFNTGFAPRKSKMTVYLTLDLDQQTDLLDKLGKCKWGRGCLYINKLADVDLDVLRQLVERSRDAKWHSS